jgi:hypothetical protein
VDRLFQEIPVSGWVQAALKKLPEEIEGQDPDYFLNASSTDLVAYFTDKYALDVPVLLENEIYIESEGDARIDVSGQRDRYFFDDYGPHDVQGTRVEIAVPFTGDPDLFRFQPNTGTTSPPRAKVEKRKLLLIYEGTNQTGQNIANSYRAEVAKIKQWLIWLREGADPYMATLEETIEKLITQRREKILANRSMVASIGLPIKPRAGETATFTVPDVRRKPTVAKPTATRTSFVPEPALGDAEYNEILGIITSMAHVMERSPATFAKIKEESLRDHFLVQLNGAYDGDATGETFNSEGKTDILIRRDDRNVFIAECKIWKGSKTIDETIEQILGYLSWRDTKTAILLFVRVKNFSSIVEQITALVEAHPSYKKTLPATGETEFRFVFGQRDDPNREIKLAVLLFAVPAPTA